MAKTKAQQDDAAGVHTRHLRTGMTAIDKIANSTEPAADRLRAVERIRRYAVTMLHRLAIENEQREDAT